MALLVEEKILSEEIVFGGRVLRLETGEIARQAAGSVIVTYGDTVVMCVVTHEPSATPYQGFATFSAHFMIRSYAFGKIPYSFFKREGKPSEYEVLASRVIDRSIRPLLPDGYSYDTQLQCFLLSYDREAEPDVPAIIGSVAAIHLAGIPLKNLAAAARVGMIDGQLVINPGRSDVKRSELDMLISSTDEAVIMIEAEASELSKDDVYEAVMFAHHNIKPVIELIRRFSADSTKPWTLPMYSHNAQLASELESLFGKRVKDAVAIVSKTERKVIMQTISSDVTAHFKDNVEEAYHTLKELVCRYMRNKVFGGGGRIDGRNDSDIRGIKIRIGMLPCVHGSSLFTRGNTQALVTVTMGSAQDEQVIDSLAEDTKSNFMLHYNFPAFSVGETASPKATGRREIGHGRLAWKAIRSVLPKGGDFPYTIRIVSEITESDGSSSMATVCGSSLALLDAGVPISGTVAGVALGILKEGEKFIILTDILGDEDHLGEMDFKIAGTRNGITALQMDVKNYGLMHELSDVLDQGLDGINRILDVMEKCIHTPREQMRSSVPFIKSIKIDKNKIREVIGASGKMIREICETTGVKIDIDQEGLLSIVAPNQSSAQRALCIIGDIVDGPQVGRIYSGTVSKVVSFGIFVHFCANKQGLVHVSVVQNMQRKGLPCEYKEGNAITVQVAGIEDFNKYRLTIAHSQDTDESEQSEGDTCTTSETVQERIPEERLRRRNQRREPSKTNSTRVSEPLSDSDGVEDSLDGFSDFDDGIEEAIFQDNDYNAHIKANEMNYEGRRKSIGRTLNNRVGNKKPRPESIDRHGDRLQDGSRVAPRRKPNDKPSAIPTRRPKFF